MSEDTFKSADKSRLHIVMVTPFSETSDHIDGGVAGVARYLADELAKKDNLKVSIVVPARGERTTREQWDSYVVYRVGIGRLWSPLPPTVYYMVAGKRKLNKVIAGLGPDIVHYQGMGFLAGGCLFPHVLTIHGIPELDALWNSKWLRRWPKYFLLKATEENGRKKVRNIIIISPYVKKVVGKTIEQARTFLIENPVADKYFEIRWRPQKGRIFYCGRIVPCKNILGLLEAFSIVAKNFADANLYLGGSGDEDYMRRCRIFVDENGLTAKVYFLGNLSIEEVENEFAKANCLVIPSFQDTAPLSIAEAMATGVPVVGARVCGIPYMIEDGKTGFLVNQLDDASIAEGICKILTDTELAHAMSVRAKQIASERFRASGVGQKTFAVYEEILAEAKAHR